MAERLLSGCEGQGQVRGICSLWAANSPAEGTAANSPGKAVIIKRASPGWEEALFIIGFALPYLLLAEEERDRRQQQEAGVTGVAAAATAAAGFCLSCGQDYDIVREKRLRLVYSK